MRKLSGVCHLVYLWGWRLVTLWPAPSPWVSLYDIERPPLLSITIGTLFLACNAKSAVSHAFAEHNVVGHLYIIDQNWANLSYVFELQLHRRRYSPRY